MVFPVVMYGCESWTVKKAECRRTDAFELWCWRRLLRVPWTARRSNQSILKEISPGCSLKGLVLKLKLQYFGHLMWRVDSLEKHPDAGRDWGQGEKGTTEDEMAGWHHWCHQWCPLTWWMWVWVNSGRWCWTGRPGVLQFMGSQRVGHDWVTELNWTELYGCESWVIKRAEHWRTDAFELWDWRRLLRVPWTARRSNQSILKEFSPEYSLEGLMLKLKLQYSGHLMWRTDSLEKTLMLGKTEGRRRRGIYRGWDDWMASPTQWSWVWARSRSWWWTAKPGVLQSTGSQRIGHDGVTKLTDLYHIHRFLGFGLGHDLKRRCHSAYSVLRSRPTYSLPRSTE